MLQGTLEGLHRYYYKKKRLLLWRYIHFRDNLILQEKKWRRNIEEQIDYAYCSTWDITDKDYILEEYKRIRLGEDTPNQITRKIERFYNDQTVYFEKGYRHFEPENCVRTIDQITDEHLTQITQLATGRSFVTMGYISQGTGTTDPDRTDTTLQTEVIRRPILADGGYIDFLGHNEMYGLIFAFDQPSILCSESGLHSTSSATTDIMACRNKFSPALNHSINSNAISINVVIQHRAF